MLLAHFTKTGSGGDDDDGMDVGLSAQRRGDDMSEGHVTEILVCKGDDHKYFVTREKLNAADLINFVYF